MYNKNFFLKSSPGYTNYTWSTFYTGSFINLDLRVYLNKFKWQLFIKVIGYFLPLIIIITVYDNNLTKLQENYKPLLEIIEAVFWF